MDKPLVSIGIPTYNRASLLRRAIDSALNQDYGNVEVIVSDNASTDETEEVCRGYQDRRFKYIRQTVNLGPTRNFSEAFVHASGQFFMWLGDDDWIDASYVASCMKEMIADRSVSLVSGLPRYYRNGKWVHDGKRFSLMQNAWWQRVVCYYAQVADNGMFYGLMRTDQLRRVGLTNALGGDWHLIANIAAMGKTKVIPETAVHRELGGATSSYRTITASLGIPAIHATFPMLSIAASAFRDIARSGDGYRSHPLPARMLLGGAVFFTVLPKTAFIYLFAGMRRIRKFFRT